MLDFILPESIAGQPVNINLTLNINWNPKIELTIRRKLSRPGPMHVTLLSENQMDVLNYSVALPAAGVDVDTREFSFTVDGGAATIQTLTAGTLSAEISVPQDSAVVLSLVDIDDAGNRSPASTLAFTATDTLPPAQPGEMAVALVSESESA